MHALKQRDYSLWGRIDNPGKLLEEEGPWFDWTQDWVKTGWATTKGMNKMMKNITELEGIIDGENKQPTNSCSLCEIQRSHTTITPSTLILYTDGSHDSGKPQATAGFGYVGIRNGDAEKDEINCYIEVQGAGPVVTDYKSPVYLGATSLSPPVPPTPNPIQGIGGYTKSTEVNNGRQSLPR